MARVEPCRASSTASEDAKGSGPLLYTGGRTQSPIDHALVANLKSIAARGQGRAQVFSKVGDSISSSVDGDNPVLASPFLACFDGFLEGTGTYDINIHLGRYPELAPTIAYFREVKLSDDGTRDSFSRVSLSAKVGQAASWPLIAPEVGVDPPLTRELAAVNPRFAVVMYGSNDIAWNQAGSYDIVYQLDAYETSMRRLVDHLLGLGVIPLMMTMPARPDYDEWVPAFTGVVRAIAQGRQIPLIDFNRELMAMGPPYGLSGDRVHPVCGQYNTCCWLDDDQLASYGYPVRNLVTLQALDRVRQAFECEGTSFDPTAPRMTGAGSAADPFLIPSVPFGELRDLTQSPHHAAAASSCAGAPSMAGPQYVYKLILTEARKLRILLLDRAAHALRLSVWSDASPSACVVSDPSLVARRFAAGTYYISVDAPTVGAEYNLSITECAAADLTCL